MPFSRVSGAWWDDPLARGGDGEGEGGFEEGSRRIAGNCMLPTSARTRSLRAVECFGAKRLAASTVTLLQAFGATSDASGVQCRVVAGAGSVGVFVGVSCKKTKGERIIRSRLPRDVVISRSSSWPIQM
jgi:hypothetical protein